MADKDGRGNIWAFVFYPESCPSDWKDIIYSWHVPCSVSPLHDADLNGDMSEKKPHYHILVNFGAGKKKSQEQVYENFSKPLNGVLPIAIDSERGYVRYFVHIDNPEKHQYDPDTILDFSGYDHSIHFKPSASLANQIMNDIKIFVIDNQITEFKDLQVYALNYPDTWGYVLNMYNCFSIYKLIDSQRNYKKVQALEEFYCRETERRINEESETKAH